MALVYTHAHAAWDMQQYNTVHATIVSWLACLASPRSTAPYQMLDPEPILTSPMMLAFGAINTSSPFTGITSCLISPGARRMAGTAANIPFDGGADGSYLVGAHARLGFAARHQRQHRVTV
eukprot:360633-Chlamydomonas_euryale.AAC.18